MNCEGLLVNLEHHCINIKYFTHLKKKKKLITLSNKKLKYESGEPPPQKKSCTNCICKCMLISFVHQK